jgi:dolichyl-phosphate-mannose-protein mannosyltransferase
MAPPLPGSPLWGWLGPLAVTLFAGFLRFDRLGTPKSVVFDETYYAKDSLALLRFGWEHNALKEGDKILIETGSDAGIWGQGPSFVAHPPGGKWMIAIGELIFGPNPFGWRFMPALCGTLAVLILCRVARRMTGSTLLGCAAGLLLAVDGLAFVTSRTALLDIFVMFWVLAAFACLIADRDRSRRMLAAKLEAGYSRTGLGPFVMNWWRVLAGVCLGMACATKWSGIFYVAAFGLLVLFWDMGARRAAGIEYPRLGALALDAVPAFVSLVLVGLLTYLATWSGWIFRSGGWGRGEVSGNWLVRPFEAMPELWRYHRDIFNFHSGLDSKHTYQSWPWDWPLLRRPVAFFYTEPTNGCDAGHCSREILGIGTPAFWWGSMVALVVVLYLWLAYRDWRAGAIVLGFLAGWLPWFPSAFGERTMFLFYATPLLPFMALAVILVLGVLIGPAPEPVKPGEPDELAEPKADLDSVESPPARRGLADLLKVPAGTASSASTRRVVGAAVAGAYLLIVLANFAYFYPLLAAKTLPYEDWNERIWFKTWI